MTSTPVQITVAAGEKGSGHSPSTGNVTPHHGGHRTRERLRHFLHPNGKKVHVASSPEDAVNLQRQLSRLHSEDEFVIYISGSPEHLSALRVAQQHHEGRREQLREEHKEVYERFARVHAELDALSEEMDRVTTHGVSLEAHFSRFGYNAHIKTYDDESPSASGETTPRSSISGRRESPVEKGHAKPLKFFKRPVLRQYFHNGILWRASSAEEVQSFELFVDLLYVGILAVQGDAAASDPTFLSLLTFAFTFTLSWKIWNDASLIIAWFETDDIFQRINILLLLAMLFGYTTNIGQVFDNTYPTLIGFYLAGRFLLGSYLFLVSFLVPMVRSNMLWQIFIALSGGSLWIVSIHTPWPNRIALIVIALVIDIFGPMAQVFGLELAQKVGGRTADWFAKHFEFTPAINIEHRTERMSAFVTLVFGYTVVALLYQSAINGIDAHYGKAVLGLTQAFCFNWLYFEVDGSNLHLHAIRRHKFSSVVWAMAHLPFIMSLVLGGGALARLVVAIDTPNSPLDALTAAYQDRAEKSIQPGIRWFYCAGFGVALAFMGVIGVSHVHKEIDGLRLKKRWRMTGRFTVAAILVCLPLATGLDSLQLVGVVTALVVFVLGLELWAVSCCHEALFSRDKPCRYLGHCGKKNMEALIKGGKEMAELELGNERTRHGGLAVHPM